MAYMTEYDIEDDSLSIEAQVALLRGDDDADELAAETPCWHVGGSRAKSFERDRLTFDDALQPTSVWEH